MNFRVLVTFFLVHIPCLINICQAFPPKHRKEDDQAGVRQNKLVEALDPGQNFLQGKDGDGLNEDRRKVGYGSVKEEAQLPRPNKAVRKRPDLVKRPDHLEAVPLERDGHLNKKFRQEVFLGDSLNANNAQGVWPPGELGGVQNEGDPHVASNKKKPEVKEPEVVLVEIFNKADQNSDRKLSVREIEEWIYQTALRHLDEAVEETRDVFHEIDQDGDGLLTWEEYHYHFLTDNKLMAPDKARSHKEEEHADLDPDKQDRMEVELEMWREANDDGQEGLTSQEFLGFRHPEHSLRQLKSMVRDIIRTLDKNGDGQLSEAEFAAPPRGEVEKQWEKEEKEYLDERKKEFREEIDLNKDGVATEEELLKYSNPRNPQHAKHEAEELVFLADGDKDGKLNLEEVLSHKAIFFDSSVMNPARNLHDEM